MSVMQQEKTFFNTVIAESFNYMLQRSKGGRYLNTKFDVIGAKHHGIPCIGVSWGYGTVEDMTQAGAAAIAYSMEELLTFLDGQMSVLQSGN